MKRSLALLGSIVAVAASVACGVERTSTVLGPTAAATVAVPGTSGTSASPSSLLGTSVVKGNSTRRR